ncbi:phage portal protein family protein [Limibacterium fermenti]|uniref:phage portal protein family protein n=1 Tax=Limibacterium fermenti TaxID=3229863 RepID=UPI0026CDAB50
MKTKEKKLTQEQVTAILSRAHSIGLERVERLYKEKQEQSKTANHAPTLAPRITQKSISQTRRDIQDWKWSKQLATSPTEPKVYLLQDVFNDIAGDALLSSQMNNRREQTISAPSEMITPDDKKDEKLTKIIHEIPVFTDVLGHIWDSEWYGGSVVEQSVDKGVKKATLINRRNTVPATGRFYPDTSMNNYIEYRDTKEFGKWILEFNSDHIGLLDKLVPYALFKKFALSCWSELCEIYGIPPRVMKTETRDPEMLDRAEAMMRDVGASAWFIIDNTEDFDFAKGVNTNGDVFNNLINLCNNEISMFVSGAVIGQDTKNGNESKEKISIALLDRLVDADKRMTEMYMNSIVIPSWIRIGWIPPTASRFRFQTVEDTDKLWAFTKDLLPYKDVDNDFIEEKFGIKVKDKPANFQ